MDFDSRAFGRRLAAARVWLGIEPKELAHRLGVSDEAVYQLERGDRKTPPKKLMLQALAKELQQTEEWLLNGPSPPWPSSSAEVVSLDEDALWKRLGEMQRGFDQGVAELRDQLQRIEDRLDEPPSEQAAEGSG